MRATIHRSVIFYGYVVLQCYRFVFISRKDNYFAAEIEIEIRRSSGR